MARQVIWSKSSLLLLQDIVKYWNNRNGTTTYSEKLYSLFQITLQQLAKYPETGGLTENARVRYKKIRTYYLYFTFDDSALKVIAVCHVKRGPDYIKSMLKE